MTQILKEKASYWSKNRVWLSAAALGMITFICIYGIRVLNVTYDAWLLNGGDLSQHYLGWCFFRNSDWFFPVGLMNSIAYPNHVSVIFTDSIPLLAVIFKGFRALLPETFQYFGIWGILCFGLQGAFGALILRHYLKDEITAIIGSLFFVIAPIVIYRMFMHSALGGQWLLLLAFWLGLERDKFSLVKKVILWSVLGFLCGSIHLYFVPMCGLIMCAFLLEELIHKKNLFTCLATGAGYCFCVLVTIYVFGGFSNDHQLDAGGLGQFSFNINGLVNPQGWSRILPTLPLYGDGAGEGLAYTGTGILILLAVGGIFFIFSVIRNRINKSGMKWYAKTRGENRNCIAYILICVLSLVISFSHKLALGNHVIWDIPYPDKMVSLWGMFRSSGRFIWPVVYILILVAFVIWDRILSNKRTFAIVICAALAVQIWDSFPQLKIRNDEFGKEQLYQENLKDEHWEEWAGDKEHIVFVSYIVENQGLLYSLSNYAVKNNMTVNNFYLAHSAARSDINKALEEELMHPQKNTLYIYKMDDENLCTQPEMDYIQIDGIIVGTVK